MARYSIIAPSPTTGGRGRCYYKTSSGSSYPRYLVTEHGVHLPHAPARGALIVEIAGTSNCDRSRASKGRGRHGLPSVPLPKVISNRALCTQTQGNGKKSFRPLAWVLETGPHFSPQLPHVFCSASISRSIDYDTLY